MKGGILRPLESFGSILQNPIPLWTFAALCVMLLLFEMGRLTGSEPSTRTAETAVPKRAVIDQRQVPDSVPNTDRTEAYKISQLLSGRDLVVVPIASTSRPLTGHRIGKWRGANGICKLTVENGLDEDAAVALSPPESNRRYRFFYIRAHESFSLRKVQAGKFNIYVRSGRDWSNAQTKFTRVETVRRFSDSIEFKDVREANGRRFSEFEVTLQPVVNGNAATVNIPDEDFPADY